MGQIVKRTLGDIHCQPRGWGHEYWIENIPDYCGKILHIFKGKKGSLHFHMNKKETMYLERGHVKLRLVDADKGADYFVELLPGDSILIPPGQVHQIIALEESDLFEFSTVHEETDSHRVQKGD